MARAFWLVVAVAVVLFAFPVPGVAQDNTSKRYEYTTGFGAVSSPWVRTAGEATSYVTGKITRTSSGTNFEGKTTLTVATPPAFGADDVADFTWKYEDCGRAFEFGRWTDWACDTSMPPGRMQRREVAPPTCSANTTMSSGFYDIGASSGANPPVLGCKGGCEVVFDGSSPAGSSLVNGEKHWYAKGAYVATGSPCSATAPETSNFLKDGAAKSAIPEDSCGANKGQGTINGRTVCYDKTEDMEGGKQDDGSKDKETSKTETQKGVNPDGSEWTKEITVKVDVDGVRTTTTTTTTRPDGTKSTETTTEHEGRPPSDKPSDDDDEEQTECQKNPSGKDCGGAPAAVGESYTKKAGTKTFEEVLRGAGDALSGSEFGHAVSAFFSVSGGGSCPVVSGTIPMLNASFTFDSFCTSLGSTVFLVIRGVLLLVASFFAFRVALE